MHANAHHLNHFKLTVPASHAISLTTLIIKLSHANYVKPTFFITLINNNASDVRLIGQFL